MEVIAHQGGWDELLLFLVPVLVFVVIFQVARGRSERQGGPEEGDAP